MPRARHQRVHSFRASALDGAARTPLYQPRYDSVRVAISDGPLQPGQRLPSTRDLAKALGVSRFPVLTAFEQLIHEGFLAARVGAGTYVAASQGGTRIAPALPSPRRLCHLHQRRLVIVSPFLDEEGFGGLPRCLKQRAVQWNAR